jgi:hypothetical protein
VLRRVVICAALLALAAAAGAARYFITYRGHSGTNPPGEGRAGPPRLSQRIPRQPQGGGPSENPAPRDDSLVLPGRLGDNVSAHGPQVPLVGSTCDAAAVNAPDADVGAKVNECDRRLGAKSGIIKLRGGGEIKTQIVVSSNHKLYVEGGGEYRASTSGPVILLDDNSSLECQSWDSVLYESTGTRKPGNSLTIFTIAAARRGITSQYPNGSMAQNIKVKGCHFKGTRPDFNSAGQTISLGNTENGEVTNNWLENTRTIGIQAGGGSVHGYFAKNVVISNNKLTGVASQNIAVTNADNVQIFNNRMESPGQVGGPGVSVIDVEPNVRDRTTNIAIFDNFIDASANTNWSTTNGIVVQNGNKSNPWGNIVVRNNTIIGARHSDSPNNRISYAGILVRRAEGVEVKDNTIKRVSRCIVVDQGARNNLIENNKLVSCGSGGTKPVIIENSSYNTVTGNVLTNQPGDALKIPPKIYRTIYETSARSDYNRFEHNDADVIINGPHSTVVR